MFGPAVAETAHLRRPQLKLIAQSIARSFLQQHTSLMRLQTSLLALADQRDAALKLGVDDAPQLRILAGLVFVPFDSEEHLQHSSISRHQSQDICII